MNFRFRKFLTRALRNENGQALPWMVFLAGLTLGAAGLTVDLGHAFISYRQLQTSTDAAAMAGAYAMVLPGATTSTVNTVVKNFASVSNGANATPNLPSPTIAITYACLPISGPIAADCSGAPVNYNVIQVTQRSTIPTYFVRALTLFGLKSVVSLPLSTTSTATIASGKNDQVNVAVVLDSTKSMTNGAQNCGGKTKINCALGGVQTLMRRLAPCTAASIKGTCVPFDQVSLFTYPNIQANTTSNDTDCKSGTNPSILNYSTPTIGAAWSKPTGTSATYMIADYTSLWSSNNSQNGSLSSTSTLVNATGGPGTGCSGGGIQAIGGVSTYFAGAIYAAQSSLITAKAAAPGSRNVMIILSDGDANADISNITGSSSLSSKDSTPGNPPYRYGSANSECHQAIDAANYATLNGTTVYSIAYGSPSSGCSTDNAKQFSSIISPCSTLQLMSSGYASGDKSHFYSDGSCSSVYDLTDLDSIFGSIQASLTHARLIPNPSTPIKGT
jgi:Putative Flp pilus-assembly TadE/G-like